MNKKVLITGARGFLGSSLIEKLEKDFEVIHFNRGDGIAKIINSKPNYLIHCAAEIYKDDLMFDSNIILTYELLRVLKDLPNMKNFVYIGSSSEYGRKLNPIKEDDNLEPDTMYEGTKACGSLLTRVYGKTYNINTSIARPFSLYGENEQSHKFFSHLYNCFVNDIEVKLVPGVHDWIHIDDFVDGVVDVMLNNKNIGEAFHFGNGIQYTNLEVFEMFCKIFNKHIKYTLVENHNGNSAGVDSDSWVADISKVKEKLNWYPKYSLEDGISKFINFKENSNE